jgi:hypothetical protein
MNMLTCFTELMSWIDFSQLIMQRSISCWVTRVWTFSGDCGSCYCWRLWTGRGEGWKSRQFCGRHKWMTPYMYVCVCVYMNYVEWCLCRIRIIKKTIGIVLAAKLWIRRPLIFNRAFFFMSRVACSLCSRRDARASPLLLGTRAE